MMQIGIIQLGNPQQVFATLDALHVLGMMSDEKVQYYLIVKQEFESQYPLKKILNYHWCYLSDSEIQFISSKMEMGDYQENFLEGKLGKLDLMINLSLTQSALYLVHTSEAKIKFGALLSEKNKLVFKNEFDQMLYPLHLQQQNIGLSISEIYALILENVKKSLALPVNYKSFFQEDFVNEIILARPASVLTVIVDLKVLDAQSWHQLISIAVSEINPGILQIIAPDEVVEKIAIKISSAQTKMKIISNAAEAWQAVLSTDYYVGVMLEFTAMLGMLQVPAFMVAPDTASILSQNCFSDLQVIYNAENFSTNDFKAQDVQKVLAAFLDLDSLSSHLQNVRAQKNASPLIFYSEGEFIIQPAKSISAHSSVVQILRVIWSYYFWQKDFVAFNNIKNLKELHLLQQSLNHLELYLNCFDFMKSFCVDFINKAQETISATDRLEFKKKINGLYAQIQKIQLKDKFYIPVVNYFRAKLSVDENFDTEEAAEKLLLNAQETAALLMAIKDLVMQTLMQHSASGKQVNWTL